MLICYTLFRQLASDRYPYNLLHQFYALLHHPMYPKHKTTYYPVADPGFPVGGVDFVGGGVDSRGGYISKNLYVKTKESGPLGGGVRRARPCRSADVTYVQGSPDLENNRSMTKGQHSWIQRDSSYLSTR